MEYPSVALHESCVEGSCSIEAAGDGMIPDPGKHSFKVQLSVDSKSSGESTAHLLEELSSPAFFERKSTEIDDMASRLVGESQIQEAIREAVADVSFCVTIADPRDPDTALIAVSEKFSEMTGYNRTEVLGKNCRFLNNGCSLNLSDRMELRQACKTGRACVIVMVNQRRSGELFLNLLDVCGLTVAENPATGDELWFLVGIQADVTHITELLADVQEQHIAEMHRVARRIREKLADELATLAVSGALMANNWSENTWRLLPTPKWRGLDGWLPHKNKLASGLAAWNDRRYSMDKAAGCCRALLGERALSQSLHAALVLLGATCLVGSLWMRSARQK